MKFKIVAINKLGEFSSRVYTGSYQELSLEKENTKILMENPSELVVYGENNTYYIPPELAKETMLCIVELE